MREIVSEFIRRGMIASGFGPLVLAALYLILQEKGIVQTLTVNEMCFGIVSLSVLAFIAGGVNVIYKIEQLPLMIAILIHGGVLYTGYLATYLVNGWLEWGNSPILIFTGIFAVSYLVIWVIIYFINKKRTASLNEKLKQKQQCISRS